MWDGRRPQRSAWRICASISVRNSFPSARSATSCVVLGRKPSASKRVGTLPESAAGFHLMRSYSQVWVRWTPTSREGFCRLHRTMSYAHGPLIRMLALRAIPFPNRSATARFAAYDTPASSIWINRYFPPGKRCFGIFPSFLSLLRWKAPVRFIRHVWAGEPLPLRGFGIAAAFRRCTF